MSTVSDSDTSNERLSDPVYLINLQYTAEEEKRVVRKFDLHLMTFIGALYLVSYLDRSNIGNANTAGLSKDLKIPDVKYQWLLTIFYIAYITFQWLTILWKVLLPKQYIFSMVIGWGIVSTCHAATHHWRELMALRFLLGIFEAGFGPGVPYYLSFFYYRHEIGFRIGMFLVAPPVAAAFAGAIAYAITKHEDNISIEPWRLLFIIEGIPTIFLGILCYWCIPNNSKSARGLTPREREIAASRTLKQLGSIDRAHEVKLKEALLSITDVKTLCCMFMYFGINVSFSTLPVYLPTIIKTMGYSASTSQGLTAPPYLAAAAMTLAVTYLSDRWRQRGYFIAAFLTLTSIGYLILVTVNVKHTGARYFATFLCSCGLYPSVAILVCWLGDMHGEDGKRTYGYIAMQCVGQCGPILGTRIYPASDAPKYKKGYWIAFGFLIASACMALFLRSYLWRLNKQLEEKYSKPQYTAVATQPHSIQTVVGKTGDFDDPKVGENFGIEQDTNRNFRYIL